MLQAAGSSTLFLSVIPIFLQVSLPSPIYLHPRAISLDLFRSLDLSPVLAGHQRQVDEKFHPKTNSFHFSRTSRACEPGPFAPYLMQVPLPPSARM